MNGKGINVCEVTRLSVNPVIEPTSSLLEGSASPIEADKQFVAATVATYGPTIRKLASGRSELNLATMSRLLARRLGLAYDLVAGEFLQLRPDQPSAPVTRERVTVLVADTLQSIAARHPDTFPFHELRPARLKKLVEAMKWITVPSHLDARQLLTEYVHARLCLKPSHNLTMDELFADFVDYESRRKKSLIARAVFRRELPTAILKLLTITRVNNILRTDAGKSQPTARRGFNGVALKTDDADVSDGEFTTEVVINPS